MNNDRRKRLRALQAYLDAAPLWDDFTQDLYEIMNEEQEAYDNLPENLQDGDQGQRMQTAIEAMQNVLDVVESLDIPSLEDAIEA